jgi:voltage-gated potassium channel
VVIFTVEYILRLWICTMGEGFSGSVRGRLKYALTPMALIDLIAIAPFYLPLLFRFDLRMVRLLRLFRLMRLFKVLRYSESLKVFTDVYRLKKSELSMCFMAILFLLIISSALVYHVEHEAQPEAFSSIPAAMWWGVATLTTVGYGDIYPITSLGKFLGSIIALLEIGLFALPAGILGSGFVVALRRKSSSKFYCPHCSEEITRST